MINIFTPGNINQHQYSSRCEEIRRILQDPESHLRSAFQPIIDVSSAEVFGFEALARLISPSSFPNIAELFPFAESIGELYPIETTCRQSAIEYSSNILQSKELLFLNVDPQVLTDPKFSSGQTRRILTSQGLTPSDVVLELTERSAIQDFKTFRKALHYYRKQGYLIALDDVGAGYSSLQSVAELHPDFLKIDRSLIQEIDVNPTKQALLETFVNFSRRIGCRVLAEGVETLDELRKVVQIGVDLVQGYIISRPSFNRQEIPDIVKKVLRAQNRVDMEFEKILKPLIEDFPLFNIKTSVGVIDQFFCEHPNITLVGFEDFYRFIGVIHRDKFYSSSLQPYKIFTNR